MRAHRPGLVRLNHSPDNIYIHLPDHDTPMLVGVAPVWIV